MSAPQGGEPGQRLRLVLASGSPRRRELLADQGLVFDVEVADIDESARPEEEATAYVERLAREKARAVSRASAHKDPSVFLAADTIVEQNGRLLGKPASTEDASRMLGTLADAEHRVHTGVALVAPWSEVSGIATSIVEFGPMSPAEIEWYVRTGEPMDKAGGYAIQGLAAPFVRRISGCYFNIVGLPLHLVHDRFRALDLDWRRLPRRASA